MEKNIKKEQRTISAIATEIKEVWKNVYFGAVPYLNAMLRLGTVNDYYGADSARDIVNYFLSINEIKNNRICFCFLQLTTAT